MRLTTSVTVTPYAAKGFYTMSGKPCLARIRGLPHIPTIKEINVRSGPGTNHAIAFKGPVGMSGLEIKATRFDEEGKNLNGKVYRWFQLEFHGGAVGWVRDDLLEIHGECGKWGYRSLTEETFAFDLQYDESKKAAAHSTHETKASETNLDEKSIKETRTMSRIGASGTNKIEKPGTFDLDRVKSSAFKVTAAFEGSGYAAYNNYDAGIVSYGLIQFTLAAGSLFAVIDHYLKSCKSQTAEALRAYHERIRNRDASLRHDPNLRKLLIEAAREAEMRQAQDEVATISYWDKVVEGYIVHRELKYPLTYALLFDMGVNFGTGHGFVRLAEERLGVAPRSKPGQNGITEEQLIAKVAELRKISHDRQAARDNLPGLRVRGDFWVDRVQRQDWGFEGDDTGNVIVNGRRIQVREA